MEKGAKMPVSRSADFPIDLDDCLDILKGLYSRKNHVVARLQTAFFEPGKDYIVSKVPLSKHKYFLTPSCLVRLTAQRGLNVRRYKRALRKQGGGPDSSEQMQPVVEMLRELQKEQQIVRTALSNLEERNRVPNEQKPRSIVQSIVDCGYWKGAGWGKVDELVDGFRACERELRASLEMDRSLVQQVEPGLYGMPCPDENPPVLLIFVLPLVEVTAEKGPIEVLCPNGSVVLTTRVGEMYGFDGSLEHRFTANRSAACTPALELSFCLSIARITLMMDPRLTG
ncbi:hypothetical protein KFL_010170030 [Klebsormidium nitens]|uniref:Uncharacterized protein n=1 Tax=Klebsormidium nitens TaxID=105231 RepID=A0A1Y1INY7_KLENI|nr:hypothetical protein KFL_010170030 [Klebsormidium nitens]|eukprot:GAQ92454.1 hypothetical protein KFL_010170030 [Klebsormidium nitens]